MSKRKRVIIINKNMETKFKKDITNIEKSKVLNLDDTDYTDPFNKDERNWINMYFIQEQLKTIKLVLIFIAIMLFIMLLK